MASAAGAFSILWFRAAGGDRWSARGDNPPSGDLSGEEASMRHRLPLSLSRWWPRPPRPRHRAWRAPRSSWRSCRRARGAAGSAATTRPAATATTCRTSRPGTRRNIFDVKGAGHHHAHLGDDRSPAAGAEPARHHPAHVLGRRDEPSVEAPIGDFFGQGWDESYPFAALPLAAGPREGRGMVSYFAMPFSNGRAHRDRERLGQEHRRLLLLRRLHGARGAAGRPRPLPRLVQPRADRGAAGGRERVVGARAAGQQHDRRPQLPVRRHRGQGPLRRRQLLRR